MIATLGSMRSLDALNITIDDDLDGISIDSEDELDDDDDVFDPEFGIAFPIDIPFKNKDKESLTRNSSTTNDENDDSIINTMSKHGPSPPKHSHNMHTNSSFDTASMTFSDKSGMSHDQWRNLMHKMNGLVPSLIETISNGDASHRVDDMDSPHIDNTSQYIESDNSSSNHPSDDDVLRDPLPNQALSAITTPTTAVDSTSKTQNMSKKHEYKPSMTQSFDPNGYDHVVNALDVLQTFCNPYGDKNQSQQNQFDIESTNNDTDEQTNSDDEVLHRDFDKHTQNNSEYQHDIGNETKNKHSEYEQLRFTIANSTISRSNSNTNNSKQSKKSKNTSANNVMDINDNDSENLNHNKSPKEKSKNGKHHRIVTPAPLSRLKSKTKSKTNRNNISFSEILSLANSNNNRKNTLASPSSPYLMPIAIGSGGRKPMISPSHSAHSPTEISVDHADEYEYRAMADGGMKRISQSYAMAPILKGEDRLVGSREISTVDVIMEDHENEYINDEHNKDIGVILKQPSASKSMNTIPIASPSPVNVHSNDEPHILRTHSLGLPPLASHRNRGNGNRKNVNNKTKRNYAQVDTEEDDIINIPTSNSFILTVDSPPSNEHHNRDNSLDVNYDEHSAFKEDICASTYTPQSATSNSMMKQRHHHNHNHNHSHNHHINCIQCYHHQKQYGFSPKHRKRGKHIPLDSNELRNDTMNIIQSKLQSPKTIQNTKRHYTQYAVRPSTSEQQPINMNEDDDIDDDTDAQSNKTTIDYLEFSNNKWTKWILLAALSICFILGVFMGFGVSWIFFVTD